MMKALPNVADTDVIAFSIEVAIAVNLIQKVTFG